MNIPPLPHGASQQSQHLRPSTASLSSTKKSSPSHCQDQLPSEVAFFPLSLPRGRRVSAIHARAATDLWGCRAAGLATSHLPFRAADAPSGSAARGHQQQRQGLEVVIRHL